MDFSHLEALAGHTLVGNMGQSLGQSTNACACLCKCLCMFVHDNWSGPKYKSHSFIRDLYTKMRVHGTLWQYGVLFDWGAFLNVSTDFF